MIKTLRQWSKETKPINKIILQASIPNGSSKNEFENFSIGCCWHFSSMSPKRQLSTQVGNHSKLVFCSMSPRTDQRRRGKGPINRQSIILTLSRAGIPNKMTSIPQYFSNLANHKFTISAEGNGIDCHRNYEAILCGCIPIVEDNEHMRRKYKNLPILWTKDYSEINEEYLKRVYEEMIDKEYDFTNMFFESHSEADQKRMLEWGTFWLKKHRLDHPRNPKKVTVTKRKPIVFRKKRK